MNKTLIFILSFTILIQSFSFQFEDVIKVPTLVKHIANHFEDGDNFSDFISMHYGSKLNTHKNTHKEHQKLPLKQYILDSYFQVYLILYIKDLFEEPYTEDFEKRRTYTYTEPTSSLFLTNVFQPPKLA